VGTHHKSHRCPSLEFKKRKRERESKRARDIKVERERERKREKHTYTDIYVSQRSCQRSSMS